MKKNRLAITFFLVIFVIVLSMPVNGCLPESVSADSMCAGQWVYTLDAGVTNCADLNFSLNFTKKYQNVCKPLSKNLDLAKRPLFTIPLFQEIEPHFLSIYFKRSPRPPSI